MQQQLQTSKLRKGKENIILSVCLNGRNDNYSDNFLKRFELSINFLAKNAHSLGELDHIEIIVTDWNSEIPLQSEIRLTPEGAKICRFISVAPKIAEKYNWEDTNFHSTRSINVGFRRGRGEYILFMPSDILVTESVLLQLLRVLRGETHTNFDPKKVFLLGPRKYLPVDFDAEWSMDEFGFLNNYLTFCSVYLKYGEANIHGLNCGSGLQILHRDVLHHIRGVNEDMGGWGLSDIESGLRVNINYPIVNLDFCGIVVYDFFATDSMNKRKLRRGNKADFFSLYINDENWGLANYDFPIRQGEYHQESEVDPLLLKKSVAETRETIFQKSLTNHKLRMVLVSAFCNNKRRLILESYYYPLAWYALNQKRIRYLEFGNHNKMLYMVPAMFNISSEIYIIQPLVDGRTDTVSSRDVIKKATNLYEAKHYGHVRFVPGDPNTALTRLRDSFIGNMSFNLVFFDPDYLGEHWMPIFKELLDYIPPDGCLVVASKSYRNIQDMDKVVHEIWTPCGGLISEKLRTGLFINGQGDVTPDGLGEIETNWRRKRISKLFILWQRTQVSIGQFLGRLGVKP